MISSEFERISKLRAIYAWSENGGVTVDLGDDAAVIEPGIVLSVDASIEDVHFRRQWIGRGATWEDVGRRAAIAALSDLAAMGARPRAILQSLTLPRDTEDSILEALARGTAEIARRYGAKVVGGNLARGRDLTITTTVVGSTDAEPVLRRDGARPGDGLFVTGVLGAAHLGLRALEQGEGDAAEFQAYVRRFLEPVSRIREGQAARGLAHAAIDVSDGLVQDIEHLCVASGVGAEIELSSLPLLKDHAAVATRFHCDPMMAALSGGEDFELVFAAPGDIDIDGTTRIGRVVSAPGVVVRAADGSVIRMSERGFDHFG